MLLWATILSIALVAMAVGVLVLAKRHRAAASRGSPCAGETARCRPPQGVQPPADAEGGATALVAADLAETPSEMAPVTKSAQESPPSDGAGTSIAVDSEGEVVDVGMAEGRAASAEASSPKIEEEGGGEHVESGGNSMGEGPPVPGKGGSADVPGGPTEPGPKPFRDVHVDAPSDQRRKPASGASPNAATDEHALAEATSAIPEKGVPQRTPIGEPADGPDEEANDETVGSPSATATEATAEPAVPERTRDRSRTDGPIAPRQYRPPTRAPAAPRRSSTAGSGSEGPRERALPVEVRLLFEHGGFARVSLLPRREPSLPEELSVSGEGNPPTLVALQEDWYQDVAIPDLSSVLRRGLVWQGAVGDLAVRWNLSGREVYVLAPHEGLSGFVSTARLAIGEDHIVLCTEDRQLVVLDAIRLAGSPDPEILGGDACVPEGWVALKGVVPTSHVPPRNDDDILEILRPLADVEIAFDGGIRLVRNSWLAGYPPRIRLRGMAEEAGQILIDGKEVTQLDDGSFVAHGWDRPGPHEVWCHSASRSYSIEVGIDQWEAWEAYRWSHGDERYPDAARSPAICGVTVRPPVDCGGRGHSVTVPTSNRLLVGAEPGQIHLCAVRGDLRCADWVAFLLFEPVWALPADPWHCDKRTARIIPVGVQAVGSIPRGYRNRRQRLIGRWCDAILAASRKGLVLSTADERAQQLWRSYRRVARRIWRSRR